MSEIADYLVPFVQGYALAILWVNTRFTDDIGDTPHIYSWQDSGAQWALDAFTPQSRASILEDCEDFVRGNFGDLRAIIDSEPAEQAGHDFAFTRNRHGTGFWDRGLGDIGDRLTANAHPYGESNASLSREDYDNGGCSIVHLDDEKGE